MVGKTGVGKTGSTHDDDDDDVGDDDDENFEEEEDDGDYDLEHRWYFPEK